MGWAYLDAPEAPGNRPWESAADRHGEGQCPACLHCSQPPVELTANRLQRATGGQDSTHEPEILITNHHQSRRKNGSLVLLSTTPPTSRNSHTRPISFLDSSSLRLCSPLRLCVKKSPRRLTRAPAHPPPSTRIVVLRSSPIVAQCSTTTHGCKTTCD
jgi:hypothetical protein